MIQRQVHAPIHPCCTSLLHMSDDLAVEILALRQQVAVLNNVRRRVPQPLLRF